MLPNLEILLLSMLIRYKMQITTAQLAKQEMAMVVTTVVLPLNTRPNTTTTQFISHIVTLTPTLMFAT